MSKRIDVGKKDSLSVNPFNKIDLSNVNLSENKNEFINKPPRDEAAFAKNRKIEIRREKAGRGGKEVTVIVGFQESEIKFKLKEFQKVFGIGGTVKAGVIELQGDQREPLKPYLERSGYKVLFTGG